MRDTRQYQESEVKVVELSGGVGGARLARGMAAIPEIELTVIVNVGDDASNHGLHISPDLDTVVYTLAGVEGPLGWGRAGDTFVFNEELARFGVDNSFLLGDRDLALKLFRTNEMSNGRSLSEVTGVIARSFDLGVAVLPASDDPVRTMVKTANGWLTFQDYFVGRRHRDEVLELRFDGAEQARPAPGVVDAIATADLVVIGPSNPPLSIWPLLAIGDIRQAIELHGSVAAVSPLIGGETVKGPAHEVMTALGLPPGNRGVVAAYEGLIDRIVIDTSDGDDAPSIEGVEVMVTPTLIKEPGEAARLARELVGT